MPQGGTAASISCATALEIPMRYEASVSGAIALALETFGPIALLGGGGRIYLQLHVHLCISYIAAAAIASIQHVASQPRHCFSSSSDVLFVVLLHFVPPARKDGRVCLKKNRL